MSIIFDLERTNQLNPLPDKDLVDLCPPIEPYQVTKSLDNLEYKLYYSWLNFPRDYTDSRTGKKFFLDEEAGKFFYEKLKGKFKDRLGGQGFLHGIDVVANIFSLSHEIKERIRKDIAYNPHSAP